MSSPQGNPSNYGANSNPFGNLYETPAQPPVTAEKTPEQLQKERMAAALFGGVIPGQAPPPPHVRPTKSAIAIKTSSPSKSVPSRTAAAIAPQPAPAPAPAPAPEMDLLDIMNFDPNPTAIQPAVGALDIFAPHPVSVPPQLVENASDDEQAGNEINMLQSNDPFDNVLMFGGMSNPPLANLTLSSKIFEHNGHALMPLPISTPQFGQHWGSCSITFPVSIQSNTIKTLEQLMNAIADIGAYKVESIAATNEGICAGQLAGNILVLIHGKLSPIGGTSGKIDITVKTTDGTLGSKLSMYLQTVIK